MKKIFGFGLIAIAMMTLTLSSCSKYEDGSFSVRSKKARLCQTWAPEKYILSSGIEYNAGANEATWTYEKDGTLTLSSGGASVTGTLEFGSGKETISTVVAGITSTVTILRLTMDELWVKDSDGDKTYFKVN